LAQPWGEQIPAAIKGRLRVTSLAFSGKRQQPEQPRLARLAGGLAPSEPAP